MEKSEWQLDVVGELCGREQMDQRTAPLRVVGGTEELWRLLMSVRSRLDAPDNSRSIREWRDLVEDLGAINRQVDDVPLGAGRATGLYLAAQRLYMLLRRDITPLVQRAKVPAEPVVGELRRRLAAVHEEIKRL